MTEKEKSMADLAAESRKLEEAHYTEKCGEYQDALLISSASTFRDVAASSDNFRNVTPRFIQENPESVRILRYLTRPVLSRDKFSDLCGIGDSTLRKYEDPNDTTTPRKASARNIVGCFEEYRNNRILPWLKDFDPVSVQGTLKEHLGHDEAQDSQKNIFTYLDQDKSEFDDEAAKLAAQFEEELDNVDEEIHIQRLKWGVSFTISESEGNTRYRNWRKRVQHQAIRDELKEVGFTEVNIESVKEINPEEFVEELNISKKEADFAIKSTNGVLVFIEAKASGTTVNFNTKRRPEIKKKYDNWTKAFTDSICVAVIGGNISGNDAVDLEEYGLDVYWDHALDDLSSLIT